LESKTQEDERLARYILGELSEHERERLEAEYFEDDDAFEQMLMAEEELTDAYVRGELSAEERAQFEKSYLSSPRGCERVRSGRCRV
jgi:anti-sigma factor RsiW